LGAAAISARTTALGLENSDPLCPRKVLMISSGMEHGSVSGFRGYPAMTSSARTSSRRSRPCIVALTGPCGDQTARHAYLSPVLSCHAIMPRSHTDISAVPAREGFRADCLIVSTSYCCGLAFLQSDTGLCQSCALYSLGSLSANIRPTGSGCLTRLTGAKSVCCCAAILRRLADQDKKKCRSQRLGREAEEGVELTLCEFALLESCG